MAEYRNPSTPTARRRLIAVASIVTAFLIGFSVSGRNDEAAGPPASGAPAVGAAPSGAPDGPGPTGDRWGIPTGFARTEAGAVTAAVGYVLTGGELMAMPPTRVPDAIALMSAEASTGARVTEAQAKLGQLREVLAPGRGATRYLQAVLAVRVEAFSIDRARVSVWSVGVLSRDGAAVPQAGWTTSTFELVWERDDWKVWSEQIVPGPTPDLNASDRPATAADLEARLQGFTIWEAGR